MIDDQHDDTTKLDLPVCPLSDLPRVLCACARHYGRTLALTVAEDVYLAGVAAAAQPATPRHHVINVVPLPEYGRARPWSTAVNVALPKGGRTCDACGDKPAGDAFICPECADDLRIHLGDVPGLLDDLDVLAQRQAVVTKRSGVPDDEDHTPWDNVLRPDDRDKTHTTVGQQLVAAGYDRPLPVRKAVAARDELRDAINRTIVATKIAPPHERTLVDLAAGSRWLFTQLDRITTSPDGPKAAQRLQHAHDRAMAAIDQTEHGVYLGLCDNEKCRTPMYADPDHAEHRCTTCKTATYDVARRRETLRHRVRSSLLSVREISDYSQADRVAFGAKLTENQLRGWVRRGRLVARSSRANSRQGGGTEALYAATDVVELVAERRAS